jgi:Carboxypeptidase regulatory-like domain
MTGRYVVPLRKLMCIVAVIGIGTAPAAPALAQSGNATLRVTVVDPSGGVIVGATVTVAGAEPATRSVQPAPVQTAASGVATIAGLVPGRYSIDAVFPGFQKRTLPDVRIRNGENRQSAMLDIERVEASVTVEQDKQAAAADRQGPAFGAALTRDQIDALSDDPATFQKQLQDMAGPGAVIRIDGFEGSALPAKAQIRSIRIARDQFAAEFHSAGGVSIEIITQPGLGPIRYYSQFLARDDGLSGRSPFVPVRGPEQNLNYGFGLGGTLVKDKSSFNLNVFGISAYDTPNLNAALPTGTLAHALNVKSPRDNLFTNGQLDYALTLDQTLRVGFNMSRFASDNLGVGGYDEPERAFSTHNLSQNVRVQHFGPVGRRAFLRTRVQLIRNDNHSESAIEAPTIRVLDAFTSGGAQRAGGDHSRLVDIGSDLDYVLGRHSFRSGISVNGGWFHSNATANYLGQYTFDNLDAFLANQPSHYTRRIGDPAIAYRNVQAGLYVQDDIRLRKNLTLTPGLRYELQTHVHDLADVGPRLGVTWAPFASGATTVRSSVGVFYDWLPTGTYDQTQRVDGFHQQELNIVNPSFPDPGTGGEVPPVNRYELSPEYRVPRTTRVSGGVDQQIFKTTRVSATYSYQMGSRLARGLNLNPIVNGARPDPAFSNIIDVVSDAASRLHQLQVDASVNPGAMLPAFRGPLVSWKRTTLFANYSLASYRNNTDGPFSIPATGELTAEWGPATGGFAAAPSFGDFGGPPQLTRDIRNRLNLTFNNQIVRNFLVGINFNTSSAPPYTLLSGRDDNGDGIFNDRPPGVGRNTLRASSYSTVNMNIGYIFAFGRTAALPPAVGVFGGGASAQVRTFDQGTARYRLQLFVNAQNLTNERNYVGYSGTLTSPFFGKPTAVSGMRKIDVGISLNF